MVISSSEYKEKKSRQTNDVVIQFFVAILWYVKLLYKILSTGLNMK